MSLDVVNLYSGYRGKPVIEDINFNIERGQIVALIGLNGAGKSTLLKTILGLIQPIKGQIKVDGSQIQDNLKAYASQLAYIPETPVLYEELTLKEHLEMTALGYGLNVEEVMNRAEPLLKQFRLDQYLNWFPIHFSKGMKQKVMIICAMVTDAKVLIIDEPFLGLDPLAIRHLTNLMKLKAKEGASILFTTHVLSMTDHLCDQYLMLNAGRLVGKGDLADLQAQFQNPGASLEDLYIQMTGEAQ